MSILRAGDSFTEDTMIKYSERALTPASDEDRLVRIEADGKLHPAFTKHFDVGDGSDGALDTSGASVNVDLAFSPVVELNYSSMNVATNNLTFTNPHANGSIVIINCQGNSTISATIDLTEIGATAATNGTSIIIPGGEGAGLNGNPGVNNGSDGAGVAGGAQLSQNYTKEQFKAVYGYIHVAPGAGSGNGGAGYADSGTDTAGGAGARGGGALILRCGGTFTFTGTIDVSGTNGTNAADALGGVDSAAAGGGGGGSAAGMVVILCAFLGTNTGTIDSSGGDGGDGGNTSVTSGSVTGDDNSGAGGSGAGSYASAGADSNSSAGAAPSSPSDAVGAGAGGAGGHGSNCRGSGATGTGATGSLGGPSDGGIILTVT